MIHWTQSVRALGVISDQSARALGAMASALRRSGGILDASSTPEGVNSSVTTSPAAAPAASLSFRFTLSQWLFFPSGSSLALNEWPLRVPSTVVMPLVGSFALAVFGRTRNPQGLPVAGVAGCNSFALKRILEPCFVMFLACTMCHNIHNA